MRLQKASGLLRVKAVLPLHSISNLAKSYSVIFLFLRLLPSPAFEKSYFFLSFPKQTFLVSVDLFGGGVLSECKWACLFA